MDWTKPIELLDGTPLRFATAYDGLSGGNPDWVGDYYLVREDGAPLPHALAPTGLLICKPDGSRWHKGDGEPVVRNREPDVRALIAEAEALLARLRATLPPLYRIVGFGEVILYSDQSREIAVQWAKNKWPGSKWVPLNRGSFVMRILGADGEPLGWLECVK